ncbi:hypothetical protein [Labrys monachus]|uniref:Uncharacterized protein n=1 Tax=Labrys monachus TaxID=217067 RepID=A0ABU0FCA0_9HYPH|nr:hypothetical protein [Labrys monachus]MDQ0392246.1 hypothetical protein [Labrys monachus]
MSRTHGPMTTLAFHDLYGWLEGRKTGGNPHPALLLNHWPQGAIVRAHVEPDPVGGSPVIAATTQSIRSETLRLKDREGDNSAARPRLRYWDPEAFLVIRLALANGGTLFVDDDGHGSEDGSRRAWHYPKMFGNSAFLQRVLMQAGQGQRVRSMVDRSHPYTNRDCRMRRLFIEEGPGSIYRGVKEFLDTAVRIYAKPNGHDPQDPRTGEQRFGADPETYRGILESALKVHWSHNPPATPEAVARWRAVRHPSN